MLDTKTWYRVRDDYPGRPLLYRADVVDSPRGAGVLYDTPHGVQFCLLQFWPAAGTPQWYASAEEAVRDAVGRAEALHAAHMNGLRALSPSI